TSSQGNVVRGQCDLARRKGARVFLHGQFGDYALAPLGYLTDLFVRLRWSTLRHHVHTTQDWMQEVNPAVLQRVLRGMFLRALTPSPMLPALRAIRNLD